MRTPLYEEHVKAGGRIVDFHGWELPVQYGGILEEHEAVRSAAGLFDVSHMGELLVEGAGAGEYIQSMVTNDISKAADGQEVYSPMCYPDGGTVDDLIVYRRDEAHYLVVVNASNIEKDYRWLLENARGPVRVTDVSAEYAQLALQGPSSEAVLQSLTGFPLSKLTFFHFAEGVDIAGLNVLLSRSGYTGEDGFELYLPASAAPALWQRILEAGEKHGVKPAGLGARDTLRFEASLPLYGQELSADISPLEAGLGRFVKLSKSAFTGREALVRQHGTGGGRQLVGLEMIDRGIPRSEYEVCMEGKKVGYVTSGGFAPTLKKNLAMALVDKSLVKPGAEPGVAVRDRILSSRIVGLPFYNKKYRKQEVGV